MLCKNSLQFPLSWFINILGSSSQEHAFRNNIKILKTEVKTNSRSERRKPKEAPVQVIESGTSHLVTSDAVSQETLSALDRGPDFSWNIYLHLGPCAYFLSFSRWGWCEITAAHLRVTLPPTSLKTFLTFSIIRSTWIPSPWGCFPGENVIKVSSFSSIYHNRASTPAHSRCLIEMKRNGRLCLSFQISLNPL